MSLGIDTERMGTLIRSTWDRLSPLPGGKRAFSKLLGKLAPYTGTIDPLVLELAPGHARVQLEDRRRVRNHLRSVHAIALMNLAEVATGLAIGAGMPDDARGILAGLSIEYVKKARGRLVAECDCEVPSDNERREYEIEGVIRDRDGDVVARAKARWLVGPRRR
jgi:acyl-coenzyme A thioesterase PaaI-like protein